MAAQALFHCCFQHCKEMDKSSIFHNGCVGKSCHVYWVLLGRDRMVVGFITSYSISAYISPLMLLVLNQPRGGVHDTTLCDKVCL